MANLKSVKSVSNAVVNNDAELEFTNPRTLEEYKAEEGVEKLKFRPNKNGNLFYVNAEGDFVNFSKKVSEEDKRAGNFMVYNVINKSTGESYDLFCNVAKDPEGTFEI